MDYKKINSWLDDISKGNKKLKFIERKSGHVGILEDSEGSQGEYNEYFDIYQVVEDPEVFIKASYMTDSYGEGNNLHSITFVKGVKKTIEVFEPIK